MTAVGDLVFAANVKRSICLMTGQTTANGAPTTATQGVPNYPDSNIYGNDTGASFAVLCAIESTLMIRNTTGTGAVTGTFVLWGFLQAANGGAGGWFAIKVNGGAAIATAITNQMAYAERFQDLGHYDRLYLEIQSPGGTGTPAFEAWLTTNRQGQ